MRKALLAGMRDMEPAVEWLLQHGEDGSIDDPISIVSAELTGLYQIPFNPQERYRHRRR